MLIENNMKSMLHEPIRLWAHRNGGRLSSKILYYRDGVSELQYQKIRIKKIKYIENAYQALT